MTQKIINFLNNEQPETPCVVIDLDIIKKNYQKLKWYLPEADVYYAMKANPGIPVLKTLADLGSNFDVASIGELEDVLSIGVPPEKISFGNTIKKEKDIKKAYDLGIRLFAVDSDNELQKIARVAPKAKIFCRILWLGEGADWPLSKKFGCDYEMAVDILIHAKQLGLEPYGVSFHPGSQQKDVAQWDLAISKVAEVFRAVYREGDIELKMINLGGGFPSYQYQETVPLFDRYIEIIRNSLNENFGDSWPKIIIEPGRSIAAEAGIVQTEIVLISTKIAEDDFQPRWVYLDIGKFGGLAETLGESIKYKFVTPKDGHETGPVIICGPTCDSADLLYENTGYTLPVDLEIGDKVLILSTGAYTHTYSSQNFNGFKPLKDYYLNSAGKRVDAVEIKNPDAKDEEKPKKKKD